MSGYVLEYYRILMIFYEFHSRLMIGGCDFETAAFFSLTFSRVGVLFFVSLLVFSALCWVFTFPYPPTPSLNDPSQDSWTDGLEFDVGD